MGALACGAPPAGTGAADALELALWRAQNALSEGRSDWARLYYAEYLETNPEHAEALRGAISAWTSGAQQSYGRALQYAERYLALEPGDDALRRLAIRYCLFLASGERARVLAELLGESPADRLVRAQLDRDARPERAAATLRALLESPEEPPGATHEIAAELFMQIGDTAAAVEQARIALDIDPLDPTSYYLLARLESLAGRTSEAERLLEFHQLLTEFLSGRSDGGTPMLLQRRQLDRLTELGLAASPKVERTRLELAVAAGRRAEAAALLPRQIAAAEHEPSRQLELASLAARNGDGALAAKVYGALLANPATPSTPQQQEACYRLARRARATAGAAPAAERLQTCLDGAPNNARLHHFAGDLAKEGDRLEAARASYRRSLELAPWRAETRVALAGAHLQLDERSAALAVLEAAPEPSPLIDQHRKSHDFD